MNRQETGRLGEKIARDHLKKKGYRIQELNYRCREGEIDIICRKKNCLVFVEVRTKTGSDFGIPEESITFAKKGKLINTALTYLGKQKKPQELWRIDFIAVEMDNNGKVSRIEHIENAVADQ
jgi:putative endonuclease